MTDKLDPNTKINVEEILEDLENYHPPRKGWTWRTVPEGGVDMAGFHFRNMSEPLKNSVRSRSEERRVGKECRSRWSPYH